MSVNAHGSLYLSCLTIPLYVYVILLTQNTLFKAYKLERSGCFQNQMGEIRQWLGIEIMIFYGNLVVLLLFIARTRFYNYEDIKSSAKIKNKYITDHLKKVYNKVAWEEHTGTDCDCG